MEEEQVLTEKQRKLIEVCWVIRLFGWLAFGVSLVVASYFIFILMGILYFYTVGVLYHHTQPEPPQIMVELREAGSNVLMGLMAVGLSQLMPYLFGQFSRLPRLARLFPWFAFAKAGFVVLSIVTQAYGWLHFFDVAKGSQVAGMMAMVCQFGTGFVSLIFFVGLGLLVRSSLPLLDDARAMV